MYKYSVQSEKVNKSFRYALLAFQLVSLVCFYFMTNKDHLYEYGEKEVTGEDGKSSFVPHHDHGHQTMAKQYASFQDVHVMIFVGFGFLMTFLKDYNWSSMGFTMMIASVVIQWGMIMHALFFEEGRKITLSMEMMYEAEFAAGAVLITFGGLLGKINHLQLFTLAIFEIVFYKVNQLLLLDYVPKWFSNEGKMQDIGGSMVIHAFGAYFGLAVAKALHHEKHNEHAKETSSYTQDLFAMIGTIFLWMYWPSFNSIPAENDNEKFTAISNTYMSLAAACITTFALSGGDDKHGRLNMVHIQNATLAGGVAMGSAANFAIGPFNAILIGTLAGAISTFGYQYLQPVVLERLEIHDTCGIKGLNY